MDGNLVVNNGGPTGPRFISSTAALGAGTHTFTVNYFEDYGGQANLTAYLDSNLTAVPEPSTWLAGAGMLAGMLGTLLRRKG